MNSNSITFGTIVIGEEIIKKIQLINKGALGTNFKLITKRESKKISQGLQTSELESRLEEVSDGIKIGSVSLNYIRKRKF